MAVKRKNWGVTKVCPLLLSSVDHLNKITELGNNSLTLPAAVGGDLRESARCELQAALDDLMSLDVLANRMNAKLDFALQSLLLHESLYLEDQKCVENVQHQKTGFGMTVWTSTNPRRDLGPAKEATAALVTEIKLVLPKLGNLVEALDAFKDGYEAQDYMRSITTGLRAMAALVADDQRDPDRASNLGGNPVFGPQGLVVDSFRRALKLRLDLQPKGTSAPKSLLGLASLIR